MNSPASQQEKQSSICLNEAAEAPLTADYAQLVFGNACRHQQSPPYGACIIDTFPSIDAKCLSYSVGPHDRDTEISVWTDGECRVEMPAAGGWLLLPADSNKRVIWIPGKPTLRQIEPKGRILREKEPEVAAFQSSSDRSSITFLLKAEWQLDWVAWHLPAELTDELTRLSPLERQACQLWGSHTLFQKPADTYIHLIDGRVYENRYSWPHKRKICSENDAHALYVTLSGLQRATGKNIYGLLKSQIVLSVLARQSEDGSWRHGEWTQHMERHFRLHCSALHMLMDYLTEEQDETVIPALAKATDFICRQHDKLSNGAWFLHDELEKSIEGMAEGPFRYLRSHAFGKSESNMLVLNTQLDTFIAVNRYARLTGDGQYKELLAQAAAATRTVLTARPADWLYRPLFKAIELTLLPTATASRLPPHKRALKRITWKYMIRLLPRIKQQFPRLVFPNGYVDREISLDIFAHVYLSINIMDLLRYYRQTREQLVLDTAVAAIHFGQRLRIWERWQELPGKAYASGFWAEALYQLCLLRPDDRHHVWLYRAVLFLESHGQGISPSIFGTNCEAIPLKEQVPMPDVGQSGIRTINLSVGGYREFLFINSTDKAVSLSAIGAMDTQGLSWSVAPFSTAADMNSPIPPLGCIRATDRSRRLHHQQADT